MFENFCWAVFFRWFPNKKGPKNWRLSQEMRSSVVMAQISQASLGDPTKNRWPWKVGQKQRRSQSRRRFTFPFKKDDQKMTILGVSLEIWAFFVSTTSLIPSLKLSNRSLKINDQWLEDEIPNRPRPVFRSYSGYVSFRECRSTCFILDDLSNRV